MSELMKFLARNKFNHDYRDFKFMQKIQDDIFNYLGRNEPNEALIFPPMDGGYRFLIHRFCEYRGLYSITVGEGQRRMVVALNKNNLVEENSPATYVVLSHEHVRRRYGDRMPVAYRFNHIGLNIDAPEFLPQQPDQRDSNESFFSDSSPASSLHAYESNSYPVYYHVPGYSATYYTMSTPGYYPAPMNYQPM